MNRLKQPEERPEVKEKVVYFYRTAKGEKKPIYVYSFRCNWRLTTRTICPEKWEQPSKGPADHNADRHWAGHVKESTNNGSS